MSKHTPTPWTLGRISKRSQTAFIDAMHQDPDLKHVDWRDMIQCNGCYELPDMGIEKAEANARHIVKAVNYHERLREALRDMLDEHPRNGVYHDCTDNGFSECEYCGALALLAELDNLEKQQ